MLEDGTQTTSTGAQTLPPVDWEARYNGLNKKFQDDRNKWVAEKEGLAKDLEFSKSWQAKYEEVFKAKEGLETTVRGLTEDHAKVLSEIATKQDALDRAKLFISEDYRDLIPLEERGLLRVDLKGDELKTYLQTAREAFANGNKNGKITLPNPPPGGRMPLKKEDLVRERNKAFINKDWAAYGDLSSQMYAAKE